MLVNGNLCDSCIKAKQTKQTVRMNTHRSQQPGEIIHSDIFGPLSAESFSRYIYFVSLVDECTEYISIISIVKKSDVQEQSTLFQSWFELNFAVKIRRIHSDQGENISA